MVTPWRLIKGAEPDAVKAASPVLNGGDEETGLYRPRLVATQLPRSRFPPRLTPSVRLQSEGNRNGNYPHPPICVWLFPSLALDDATAGARRWPNKRQVLLMRKGVFHIPLGRQSHTSQAGLRRLRLDDQYRASLS
jgi:hypothetical protein